MTGEGLVVSWLRELEFRNVRAPRAVVVEETGRGGGGGGGGLGGWGEVVSDVEIWKRGERVEGVRVELQALGAEHMVATVVKGLVGGESFPAFEEVDVQRDIIPVTRAPQSKMWEWQRTADDETLENWGE